MSLVLAAALVLGLAPLGAPVAIAEPATAAPGSHDVRAAVASGSARSLLASVPAVPPLRVGYKAGLFPTLASTAKDARGCTLRNQMLIKLAAKKPAISSGCRLKGGEWVVDFGKKVIKQASQVKLAKIVPDVYVYGQGASRWTQAQRNAFVQVVPPVKLTGSSKTRSLPMPKLQPLNRFIPLASNITPLSFSAERFVVTAANLLMTTAEPTQAQLDALKATNPGLFANWSLATLLNAKAWGLSLSPSLHANFQLSLSKCPTMRTKSLPMPISNISYDNIYNIDPCTDGFVVTEVSETYKINVVPQTVSTTVTTDPLILSEYGTPTGEEISRRMFGIHSPADWTSDLATGYDGPIDPATIPTVPVGFLRLWDTETTWKDIEPTKGNFVWRKLDKQIQVAQALDAEVMLVLGQTPAWAGNGSPQSNPSSLDDWRNYVRAVCQHYGGSIKAYEVWNEANLQTFWTGTPTQMADLTKAAFDEIRACNPSAEVVAANTTSRAEGSFGTFFPAYLDELRARNWPVDAYSVHSYPSASGGADARIKGIAQFRAALALAGAPVTRTYDTEINYGLEGLGQGHVDLTGYNAMTLMSRTYIDSARYGFGSTFWFVWTKAPDSKFGIQFTSQASAERQAWTTTYDWLVGARFQRCLNTSEGITVCQFSKGGQNFSIVWRGDIGTEKSETTAGYFADLGSRMCTLTGTCLEFDRSKRLDIGPMPVRIDGPAVTAGPTAPPGPADWQGVLAAPTVGNIDIEYGVSNKVDATATWSAGTLSTPLPADARFSYRWVKCNDSACTRSTSVAQGETSANMNHVTSVLTEGPGKYYFQVGAVATGWTSYFATKTFEVLATRSAPPNNVQWGIYSGKLVAYWDAPKIKSDLIKGYQVQFKNITKDTAWVTLDNLTAKTELSVPKSDVAISPGETGIVRVRTVLKSGQTSSFMASEPWKVEAQLTAPLGVRSASSGGRFFLNGFSTGGPSEYPKFGWQARYSSDNGATWTLAEADLVDAHSPSAAELRYWPYEKSIYVVLPAQITNLQLRSISNTDALPSDWVNFDY